MTMIATPARIHTNTSARAMRSTAAATSAAVAATGRARLYQVRARLLYKILYDLGMPEGYSVEIETSAAKQIARLQRGQQVRIVAAIKDLGTDPRPSGCTKLSGTTSSYRVRVGDYRIVYIVEDSIRIVTVTRVGHRREVYR